MRATCSGSTCSCKANQEDHVMIITS
uniref:Uncharacterized protein n=1 Tax=Anguilla anguilla TaxID=7936 RepID=A0A0E9T5M2_ANGAN